MELPAAQSKPKRLIPEFIARYRYLFGVADGKSANLAGSLTTWHTTTLEVSGVIGEKFGVLKARSLDEGRTLPEMNLFIAATALIHDLTLVSHNAKDFKNIPGIRIQDWLEA